jgi:hypothetical protein
MNADETRAAITWANQIDPLVQMNQPTLELWAKVLHGNTPAEVHAAITVYYERPYTGFGKRPPIEAPMIRRIVQQETERATAKASAVKALPRGSADPTASWRDRNPDEWDQLVAKGREDRRKDLERRGIPMMDWQAEKETGAGLSPAVRFQNWGAA